MHHERGTVAMTENRVWTASLLVEGALYIVAPTVAAPASFTWNPADSSPPLTGSGTAFTADTISLDFHLNSVGQPDGTFAARHINVVTGFSLNGNPVTPDGFGTSYGLYFDILDTGGAAPPVPLVFTSSNITLKADPGNQNGAASSSLGGVGFANEGPTGAADDITLATGSLLASSTSVDSMAGVLNSYFLNTFTAAPGQAGFFVDPALNGSVLIEFPGTVSLGQFVVTPLPNGTVIQTADTTGISARLVPVPEPSSIVLLGTHSLHEQWGTAAPPLPPPEPQPTPTSPPPEPEPEPSSIDWNALAAQIEDNFAATGCWYL
jgi:hypothetical protein